MGDEATLWTILVLYLLAAGLIGGLLPTWPLSVAATTVFALGFLLLCLVNVPEIGWDLAQFMIAMVARKSKLRQCRPASLLAAQSASYVVSDIVQ
jgi:hypothetical protein